MEGSCINGTCECDTGYTGYSNFISLEGKSCVYEESSMIILVVRCFVGVCNILTFLVSTRKLLKARLMIAPMNSKLMTTAVNRDATTAVTAHVKKSVAPSPSTVGDVSSNRSVLSTRYCADVIFSDGSQLSTTGFHLLCLAVSIHSYDTI